MGSDIAAMLWKEWRELLAQGGTRRGGKYMYLVLLFIPGIFMPAQIGKTWVTSSVALFFAQWIPIFLVVSLIAEAIAGERERHTLETLLASRLSDRAILIGKVLVAVLYGWATTAAVLLLSALTVNIVYRGDGLLFYRPAVLLGTLLLSPITCGLVACLGVLISLRAATVRQAQRIISFLLIIVVAAPSLLASRPSRVSRWLEDSFRGASLTRTVVILGAALLVVDGVLLAIAIARFQRARLILD
jgi:ABC-2 type transport system permease protein